MQRKTGPRGTPRETAPTEQKEYSPGRDAEGEPAPPAPDDPVTLQPTRSRPTPDSPVHKEAGAQRR